MAEQLLEKEAALQKMQTDADNDKATGRRNKKSERLRELEAQVQELVGARGQRASFLHISRAAPLRRERAERRRICLANTCVAAANHIISRP